MFHKAQQTQTGKNAATDNQGTSKMAQDSKTQSEQSQNNVDIPQAGNTGGAYAPRPAQSSSSMSSQFPASGATSPVSQTGISAGRRLVIGSGITMSGEIAACDHLVVEGTVEAALKGANVLDVAETGTFYGKVEIDEATIAGRFEGEITVKGRLTVQSSGFIKGAISYGELAVEAGATLEGTLQPYSESAPVAAKPTKSSAKSTKDAKTVAGKKQAANASGSELPFASKSVATAAE